MINKKIPICIISFNRSYYLRSLLFSLMDELENFEIVVVENGSTETLMKSVKEEWSSKIEWITLPGGNWINDEYRAKNAFLDYCKSKSFTLDVESVIFLQDDLQYVGPRGQLKNIIKEYDKNNVILTGINGIRKSTILSTLSNTKIDDVWLLKDSHFGTMGLYKFFVFDEVGKYSDSYPLDERFWGRGEDDYHSRVISKYVGSNWMISGQAHVPVFVGVWNDPRGYYSFIRNNKRIGHYLPPIENTYYRNLSIQEYEQLKSREMPSSFVDVAIPVGWSYAKDNSGDQLKYPQSQIMCEGPFSDIF